ncbi:hypothetical protein NDU88_002039 [Pleurodeles waltl]|uniref:Uncharacterized protein n=1 Tax=Pleurodeles waltl TaxID=8319 RepID=A0AAV7WNR5_PLEWA|nr:hypothetical protein NDU88_002039 [Pleurodeles waltl]
MIHGFSIQQNSWASQMLSGSFWLVCWGGCPSHGSSLSEKALQGPCCQLPGKVSLKLLMAGFTFFVAIATERQLCKFL